MPYFVRLSPAESVPADLERGYSSYAGDGMSRDCAVDLVAAYWDAIEDGDEPDDEQIAEWLDEAGWREGTDGLWRQYHHRGLSCRMIDGVPDDLGAAARALIANDPNFIGGGHEAMIDAVWVASVDRQTHIFWADEWEYVE